MVPYKATIVVCTYKGNQAHLKEATRSYLNQTDCDVQLIISTVDSDESLNTLRDFDVEFVTQKTPSIYGQLNNATKYIKNEWWCYMSGNDVALPNKLKDEINLCKKENKKICYSAYNVVDEELNFIRKLEFLNSYSFEINLEGNFVADTSLIHKSISDTYLPFSMEFDNLGYWDFWLRIGKEHADWFVYNPNPTWNYRVNKDSRHIKRTKDESWALREFQDRKKMLERFGPLRGKYAKPYRAPEEI